MMSVPMLTPSAWSASLTFGSGPQISSVAFLATDAMFQELHSSLSQSQRQRKRLILQTIKCSTFCCGYL
jgi:hypothetical protein